MTDTDVTFLQYYRSCPYEASVKWVGEENRPVGWGEGRE